MNTTDKQYLTLLEDILATLHEIRDAQNVEEEETIEPTQELQTETFQSQMEERAKKRIQRANSYFQTDTTADEHHVGRYSD